MKPIRELIERLTPRMRQLRRELHQHPEVKYEEFETSRRIQEVLREIPGLELRTGVAVTGIVATLGADKIGRAPCVALRADMDALPQPDKAQVPHVSRIPNRAHACGHDGHIVSLLGAALVLSEIREELAGPVKFLFQPAEEGGAGADRMVQEGALEAPEVAAVFGYHNAPANDLPFGTVALRPGVFMAACSSIRLKICGLSGHAAYPHTVIDPIVAAAQVITALQTVVARTLNPLASGVVSITSVHAGDTYNTIPKEVEMKGTVRALDEKLLAQLETRVDEVVHGVCASLRARAELEFFERYPPLINRAEAVDHVAQVARATGRADRLRLDYGPVMGGEDFAFYEKKVPAAFYFLATKPNDQTTAPQCHNASFDFNDDILPDAIEMHVEIARRFAGYWAQRRTV